MHRCLWSLASLILLSACAVTQPAKPDLTLAPSGKAQSVVVFVHGFSGSPEDTWGPLLSLLREDTRLRDFDIRAWGYPTQIVGRNLGVKQIAELLRTAYVVDLKGYRSIYFIAHSLGGLVVQKMIVEELKAGNAEALKRVRHVLMLASPQEGLQIPGIARHLNRVAYDVHFESELIDELRSEWINRVYAPKIRKGEESYKLTVPTTAVIALEDQFIPERSVRAYFEGALTVAGDHFSMKDVASPADRIYKIITAVLVEPQKPASLEDKLIAAGDMVRRGYDDLWKGNVDAALDRFSRARTEYKAIADLDSEAIAVRGLADTLYVMGRGVEAEAYYRDALRLYEKARNPVMAKTGEGYCKLGLGDLAGAAGRATQAKWYYTDALSVFLDLGNRRGEAATRLRLGQLHLHTGDWQESRRQYDRALKLYEAIGDRVGLAQSKLGIAGGLLLRGEYQQAEWEYEDARGIFASEKVRGAEGEALAGLGRVALDRADYLRAERQFKEVIEILGQVNHPLAEVNARSDLGEVYIHAKRYPEAKQSFSTALKLATQIRYQGGMAGAELGLGDVDLANGAYRDALKHYETALVIFTDLRNPFNEGIAFLKLGDAYRELKLTTQSRYAYSKALDLFRLVGYEKGEQEIQERLKNMR